MAFPVGTAAVSWFDGQEHIRVYSTDGYTVTERQWDGSEWVNGSFSQPGGTVSATFWQDNGVYIRVYCTFEDQTAEWCSDAGGAWYQGGYTV